MSPKLKTTGKIKRATFDEKVALIGMGVKTCSSRLERSAYFQVRRMRPKDELRSISSNIYLEKHTDMAFDGVVEYKLKIEDKANKATPVNIECAYQAHFHAPKGFRREEAEAFVREYLAIITWPYFREFVSDMSSKMVIGPLTLPLLPDIAQMSMESAEVQAG
jgi:preprotein translocase subunit SecB